MESEYIRVRDLPKLTGIKASTWRKQIFEHRCPIPFRRTESRVILFRRSDVQQWLDALPEVSPALPMDSKDPISESSK